MECQKGFEQRSHGKWKINFMFNQLLPSEATNHINGGHCSPVEDVAYNLIPPRKVTRKKKTSIRTTSLSHLQKTFQSSHFQPAMLRIPEGIPLVKLFVLGIALRLHAFVFTWKCIKCPNNSGLGIVGQVEWTPGLGQWVCIVCWVGLMHVCLHAYWMTMLTCFLPIRAVKKIVRGCLAVRGFVASSMLHVLVPLPRWMPKGMNSSSACSFSPYNIYRGGLWPWTPSRSDLWRGNMFRNE